jgi:hypothetical protein
MATTKTTLERAFEVARSGLVGSVPELGRLLDDEGLVASQIDGPDTGRKLRLRIERASHDCGEREA